LNRLSYIVFSNQFNILKFVADYCLKTNKRINQVFNMIVYSLYKYMLTFIWYSYFAEKKSSTQSGWYEQLKDRCRSMGL